MDWGRGGGVMEGVIQLAFNFWYVHKLTSSYWRSLCAKIKLCISQACSLTIYTSLRESAITLTIEICINQALWQLNSISFWRNNLPGTVTSKILLTDKLLSWGHVCHWIVKNAYTLWASTVYNRSGDMNPHVARCFIFSYKIWQSTLLRSILSIIIFCGSWHAICFIS